MTQSAIDFASIPSTINFDQTDEFLGIPFPSRMPSIVLHSITLCEHSRPAKYLLNGFRGLKERSALWGNGHQILQHRLPYIVLVTTATGFQGAAIARHLLKSGQVKVRCLVRDPSAARAQELEAQGAELVKGSYTEVASLEKACQGCNVLYLNTLPTLDIPDLGLSEVEQAQHLLHAAEKGGITQVICSTSAGSGEHDKFETLKELSDQSVRKYWEHKKQVQEAVQNFGKEKGSDRRWTILQPAWLMSDFVGPNVNFYFGESLAKDGVTTTAFRKDTKVQLTDAEDIGAAFTAAVLAQGKDREKWDSKIIKVGSDELSIEDMAKMMSEVSGRQITVKYMSDETVKIESEKSALIAMEHWAAVDGTGVDMQACKNLGLPMTKFQDFLQQNKADLMVAVGKA